MLGFADGTAPYVLPMSFGYDGEHCFVQMTTTGRKNRILAENPNVCLAIISTDPAAGTSTTVLVEGSMRKVSEADAADGLAAMADNAEFGGDLSVWGEPVQDVDLALYRIEAASISGRTFAPGEQQNSEAA